MSELHLYQLEHVVIKKKKRQVNETKRSIQACAQCLIHKPILEVLGSDLYFSILLSAMLDIPIIKPG